MTHQKNQLSKSILLSKSKGIIYGCALGDALGYNNGNFEFNNDTLKMHQLIISSHPNQKRSFEHIDLKKWRVSDDTVMHAATIDALITQESNLDIEEMADQLAKEYIKCWKLMPGRGPGMTCGSGIHFLETFGIDNRKKYKYESFMGGCGGSMRAMAIGLRYFSPQHRDQLVAVAIESARLTHNQATGILGAVCSAAFTAFALEEIPLNEWPYELLEDIIPRALNYFKKDGRDALVFEKDYINFVDSWKAYLNDRKLTSRTSIPIYPNEFQDPLYRDDFYKKYSYNGWFGASGDDSVIVAFDALLANKENLDELIFWACLNSGDCDSIGAIALAWYGGIYGFSNFHSKNLENLEMKDRYEQQVQQLYTILLKDDKLSKYIIE